QHVPQQDQQERRHQDQQNQRAVVVLELAEDAPRGRHGDGEIHAATSLSRMSRRKACSRSSAWVRVRSASGGSVASSRPSRINSRWSHRLASSITWLDTSNVTPLPASERNRAHSSSRSTGSSPTVGSSSTSSPGLPSTAPARFARLS